MKDMIPPLEKDFHPDDDPEHMLPGERWVV